MVSNKAIWILIILSLLLLGASFAISTLNTDSEELNTDTGEGGNQQGSIGLIVNPPTPSSNVSGAG